ncbi:hypothetical protein ACFYM0_15045 [Streptomyces sp. NPDC006487]|uniref:hypothetical protein n=1 Tax=Streptomyces sp. NPDC006487 TaxID=3364748 RepID=UPI0036B47CEC
MDATDHLTAGAGQGAMVIVAGVGMLFLTALFAPSEYSERAFRLMDYCRKPSPDPARPRGPKRGH